MASGGLSTGNAHSDTETSQIPKLLDLLSKSAEGQGEVQDDHPGDAGTDLHASNDGHPDTRPPHSNAFLLTNPPRSFNISPHPPTNPPRSFDIPPHSPTNPPRSFDISPQSFSNPPHTSNGRPQSFAGYFGAVNPNSSLCDEKTGFVFPKPEATLGVPAAVSLANLGLMPPLASYQLPDVLGDVDPGAAREDEAACCLYLQHVDVRLKEDGVYSFTVTKYSSVSTRTVHDAASVLFQCFPDEVHEMRIPGHDSSEPFLVIGGSTDKLYLVVCLRQEEEKVGCLVMDRHSSSLSLATRLCQQWLHDADIHHPSCLYLLRGGRRLDSPRDFSGLRDFDKLDLILSETLPLKFTYSVNQHSEKAFFVDCSDVDYVGEVKDKVWAVFARDEAGPAPSRQSMWLTWGDKVLNDEDLLVNVWNPALDELGFPCSMESQPTVDLIKETIHIHFKPASAFPIKLNFKLQSRKYPESRSMLLISPKATVQNLRQEVAKTIHKDPHSFKMLIGSKKIELETGLAGLLKAGCTVVVEERSKLLLNIVPASRGEPFAEFPLFLHQYELLGSLKQQVCSRLGVALHCVDLLHADCRLDEGNDVRTCRLRDNDVVAALVLPRRTLILVRLQPGLQTEAVVDDVSVTTVEQLKAFAALALRDWALCRHAEQSWQGGDRTGADTWAQQRPAQHGIPTQQRQPRPSTPLHSHKASLSAIFRGRVLADGRTLQEEGVGMNSRVVMVERDVTCYTASVPGLVPVFLCPDPSGCHAPLRVMAMCDGRKFYFANTEEPCTEEAVLYTPPGLSPPPGIGPCWPQLRLQFPHPSTAAPSPSPPTAHCPVVFVCSVCKSESLPSLHDSSLLSAHHSLSRSRSDTFQNKTIPASNDEFQRDVNERFSSSPGRPSADNNSVNTAPHVPIVRLENMSSTQQRPSPPQPPRQVAQGLMSEATTSDVTGRPMESSVPSPNAGRPIESSVPSPNTGCPIESSVPSPNAGRPIESSVPSPNAGRPIESSVPSPNAGRPIESSVPSPKAGRPIESSVPSPNAGRPIESSVPSPNAGRPVESSVPSPNTGCPIESSVPSPNAGRPIKSSVPSPNAGRPIECSVPSPNAGRPIESGVPSSPSMRSRFSHPKLTVDVASASARGVKEQSVLMDILTKLKDLTGSTTHGEKEQLPADTPDGRASSSGLDRQLEENGTSLETLRRQLASAYQRHPHSTFPVTDCNATGGGGTDSDARSFSSHYSVRSEPPRAPQHAVLWESLRQLTPDLVGPSSPVFGPPTHRPQSRAPALTTYQYQESVHQNPDGGVVSTKVVQATQHITPTDQPPHPPGPPVPHPYPTGAAPQPFPQGLSLQWAEARPGVSTLPQRDITFQYISKDMLLTVARQLGYEAGSVMRQLLPESVVTEAEQIHQKSMTDRHFHCLKKWCQISGREASVGALKKVLVDNDRTDLKEILDKMDVDGS